MDFRKVTPDTINYIIIMLKRYCRSLKLEWLLTTANATGTNGLICLNMPSRRNSCNIFFLNKKVCLISSYNTKIVKW
jgi:hypothetical protein